ncbi:hypothetical protein WP50_06895 [Lactiplantibacillus plantarum]|nr:hypothetical protein WP50_06895 [Lactiplantibacillus plantarum]
MNAILIHQIIWRRVIGNLLFTLPFSFLIQWFTDLIQFRDLIKRFDLKANEDFLTPDAVGATVD